MKLISRNGVLPGAGANGATSTYNPSSQTCSSGGCGLDGSGCGSQGNKFDLDRCNIVVDDTPAPTPTSFAPAPTPTSFSPAPTPASTVNTPFPTQSNCKDNSNFRKGKKQKSAPFSARRMVSNDAEDLVLFKIVQNHVMYVRRMERNKYAMVET